jgi:uncharacterized protein YndB with AHSA1/START domain
VTVAPALAIRRVFNAAIERVFDAWMQREQWETWIGPAGVQCEVPEMDARVGGRYRLVMHMAAGQMVNVVGTFRIIERPDRFAFSWMMEGGEHDSLVTVSLRDLGGKTELTLQHDGLLSGENVESHGKGWNSALNKLENYLGGRT